MYNVDLRGHGRSPHADSYRAVDYAADVAELVRAERAGRPVVVIGHSLGGLTGSALAVAAPELVAGLFLEDPPLFEGDDEIRAASPAAAFFPRLVAAIRAWQSAGADIDTVAEAIGLQPSPHGTVLERLGPERVESRAEALLRFDPRAMDAAISGETWEGYDPVASMSCPVTLLRADPAVGAVFRPEDVGPFQAAVPQAEVIMVPGQAHGIHEDPEGREPYLDAIDRFLADLA